MVVAILRACNSAARTACLIGRCDVNRILERATLAHPETADAPFATHGDGVPARVATLAPRNPQNDLAASGVVSLPEARVSPMLCRTS